MFQPAYVQWPCLGGKNTKRKQFHSILIIAIYGDNVKAIRNELMKQLGSRRRDEDAKTDFF